MFTRMIEKRDGCGRSRSPFVMLLATALAGCGTPRAMPPPATPHDYHDRHPVVLMEAPQVLDVFPSSVSGSVDKETQGRIRAFVSRYRQLGRGPVTLLVPVGGDSAKASAAEAPSVRRELAAAGLSGRILMGEYAVTDQKLAAPLRLSFSALKAKVPNRCGEWPSDLASGNSLAGWQNDSYWNFGCAEQSTFAAQVADPRDLANPRGETASDIEMRMRGIEKIRKGEDPSTNWRLKGSTISSVGGG